MQDKEGAALERSMRSTIGSVPVTAGSPTPRESVSSSADSQAAHLISSQTRGRNARSKVTFSQEGRRGLDSRHRESSAGASGSGAAERTNGPRRPCVGELILSLKTLNDRARDEEESLPAGFERSQRFLAAGDVSSERALQSPERQPRTERGSPSEERPDAMPP
jgi:hypothetical protein